MGYSNNKWRKILTILMIVNLCFILFAKFSKVFGTEISSFDVETSYGTFKFPTWIKNYNYAILCSYYNNGPHCAFIILDDNVSQCQLSETSSYYLIENKPVTRYSSGSGGWSCLVSEEDAFSHYTIPVGSIYSMTLNKFLIDDNLYYYSNFDFVSYDNNNIIFPSNSFLPPFFDNVTEIENGNPDGVFISAGSLADTDNLYFHLLDIHTGVSSPDNSVYYYSDKTFLLNKNSGYYSTYQDTNEFYYYIPRYKLGLSQNTSYLYVLNNSSSQIQNSNGIYEKDVANGIYDVLQSDTAGVISATEEQSDIMRNMEQQAIENSNSINNINNALNDTNVSNTTNNEINANLNFNNNNNLSNTYNNFFSRLTSSISSISNYNLTDVSTINLPIPHSNQVIPIYSNLISSHLPSAISTIITAFWLFIFGKYFIAFILKIYKLIITGEILNNSNTSHETITNDVL